MPFLHWFKQKFAYESVDDVLRGLSGLSTTMGATLDVGQMAAWYIFGVMGFYPVTPASGVYAIGAPQFPKLTLHYKVGDQPKTLTIIADGISEENKYIQEVRLDGKVLAHPFISHEEIVRGSRLVFKMGPAPNKGFN